jgi:hypothetical protein
MILFGERLKNLRETVMEYLMNKVEERGPIILDRVTKLYKMKGQFYIGHADLSEETGEELENLDIEELCDLADRTHTLSAKGLKI